MKYFEVEFTISPYSVDASDLLAALVGEVGFESFEETPGGLLGYVQQSLFEESALQEAVADFPFEGVAISYDIREAEDRDWNEVWENEGFEPIVVLRDFSWKVEGDSWKVEGDSWNVECGMWNENTLEGVIIHDGRHLPADDSPINLSSPSYLQIEIDARQAFGTGTHETTRMICSTLLDLFSAKEYSPSTLHLPPSTKAPSTKAPTTLLDCGTGTGILSICALKLGAEAAVGYDIDEWSVDNARHNAVINQVDDRFIALLGDATILNKVEGTFDIVVANINRNILLADMPAFREKMAPGATLILSGFYTADAPLLIDKAQSLGLTLQRQKEDHDWACLVFTCVICG